ncbi:MAG: ankyrin repeat domain-containing protein [Planctomycetaceae bacterium]
MDAQGLSHAVWTQDLAAVEALIAAGVDVNVADDPHPPPLHLAIEQGNIEIVRRLINAGAELNRPFRDWGEDFTPLVHAIDLESDAASQGLIDPEHESTELTKTLLAAGAIPTAAAFEVAESYQNDRALVLLRRYAQAVQDLTYDYAL